jgi:hypothetical protein
VTLGGRFRLAYLGLAALFGVAVGTFIVVERQPAPKPPPPWSSWKPNASDPGVEQQQIALHVGDTYHLASGKKLVNVVPRGPGTQATPVAAVAVANTPTPSKQSDFAYFTADTTPMYILCGDGPKCSIKEGKASTARGAVLGREALELALYTLRYIDRAKSVVAIFPPAKGKTASYALFFDKSDFSSELKQPLRRTLPQRTPPVPGRLAPDERKVVDGLLAKRVFRFTIETARNGARVLVLVPDQNHG